MINIWCHLTNNWWKHKTKSWKKSLLWVCNSSQPKKRVPTNPLFLGCLGGNTYWAKLVMCWPRGEYLIKESKGDTFATFGGNIYTHIIYIYTWKVKLVVQLLFDSWSGQDFEIFVCFYQNEKRSKKVSRVENSVLGSALFVTCVSCKWNY